MVSEGEANRIRQELLDAVSARGDASRRLRSAHLLGPFRRRVAGKAQADLDAANERVSKAFDQWHDYIGSLSLKDFDGGRAEEES